jgi:hypothetical protein
MPADRFEGTLTTYCVDFFDFISTSHIMHYTMHYNIVYTSTYRFCNVMQCRMQPRRATEKLTLYGIPPPDPKTRQITARLPTPLFEKVQSSADADNISITDFIVKALMQYLGGDAPGFCPECSTVNSIDANYCSNCGEPLSEKAKATQAR